MVRRFHLLWKQIFMVNLQNIYYGLYGQSYFSQQRIHDFKVWWKLNHYMFFKLLICFLFSVAETLVCDCSTEDCLRDDITTCRTVHMCYSQLDLSAVSTMQQFSSWKCNHWNKSKVGLNVFCECLFSPLMHTILPYIYHM